MSPAARKAAAANQANATLAGAHAHTLLQSLGRSANSSASFDSTVRSVKDEAIRDREAPPPTRVIAAKTVQRNMGATPPATVGGVKSTQLTRVAGVGPKAMVGAPSQRMASPQRTATKGTAGVKSTSSLPRQTTGSAAKVTSPAQEGQPHEVLAPQQRPIPVTTTTHVKQVEAEEEEDLFLLADDVIPEDHTGAYYAPAVFKDPGPMTATAMDKPPSPVEVVRLETSIIKDDSPPRATQVATEAMPLPEFITEDRGPAVDSGVVDPNPLSPPPPILQIQAEVAVDDEPFGATVVALDGTYGVMVQSWGSDPCTTNEASHSVGVVGARETEEGSPLPHRPEEVPEVKVKPITQQKASSNASVKKAAIGTPVSATPPGQLPATKSRQALPKPSVVVANPPPPSSSVTTGPLFCTNCGQKHVQGGKFCGYCGYKREVIAPK